MIWWKRKSREERDQRTSDMMSVYYDYWDQIVQAEIEALRRKPMSELSKLNLDYIYEDAKRVQNAARHVADVGFAGMVSGLKDMAAKLITVIDALRADGLDKSSASTKTIAEAIYFAYGNTLPWDHATEEKREFFLAMAKGATAAACELETRRRRKAA